MVKELNVCWFTTSNWKILALSAVFVDSLMTTMISWIFRLSYKFTWLSGHVICDGKCVSTLQVTFTYSWIWSPWKLERNEKSDLISLLSSTAYPLSVECLKRIVELFRLMKIILPAEVLKQNRSCSMLVLKYDVRSEFDMMLTESIFHCT